MPNDTALKSPVAPAREIPHTVSPGLWTLAWRRLKTDSVAMVSLAIVAAFILLMIVSGAGLVAKDWAQGGRRQLRAAVVARLRAGTRVAARRRVPHGPGPRPKAPSIHVAPPPPLKSEAVAAPSRTRTRSSIRSPT